MGRVDRVDVGTTNIQQPTTNIQLAVSLNQQAYRGDDGEREHHDFEGGLIDAFEDHRAEQRAGYHGQKQDGVHAE